MNIENRIIMLERKLQEIQAIMAAEAKREKTPAEELDVLLGDASEYRAEPIELCANNVAILAANFATVGEMAGIFRLTLFDFEQRLKESDLHQAVLSGRARAKRLLSETQLKGALGGDIQMQIWLGKQYLGQTNSPTGKPSIDDDLPEEGAPICCRVPWTPEMEARFKAINKKYREQNDD